ncbi:FKBP-type peptidyl-prolyl cis-trans isomerase N-terminal domain-containing protein [Phytobacter massiliensis]|uniref:FKBP-type peptidyl-prolyl cis-trans isomerase N-terminal domain-containing protein n=1 Tax=Phytobacter massiliensis TaxID=1485952 RepID=UPI000310C6F2|nr:FKBP-type peptidyl-prolyl cis-trans isomerase N-terminal domain-containing protein [Phytobacter massiliensis]
MKKLLTVAVILLFTVKADLTYADSTLLIERLKDEGMLIPQANPLFIGGDEKPAAVNPAPRVAPAPATAPPGNRPLKPSPQKQPKRPAAKPNAELTQLKRRLNSTTRELEALRGKYNALAARQPDDAAERTESLASENKQLHQQLMAAEKQLADVSRRYEKQTQALTAQAEKVQAKLVSTQLTLNEKINQHTVLEQKLTALSKQDSEKAQLAEQLAGAQKQGGELRSQLTAAMQKGDALEKKVSELEAQAQERAKQSLQNVQALTREKRALEQQLATLSTADSEKAQLAEQLAGAQKQGAALAKRGEALTQELALATQQQTEQAKLIKSLEQRVKKAGEEKTQSDASAAALQEKNTALAAALETEKQPRYSLKKHTSEQAKANYAFGAYYAAKVMFELKLIESAGLEFAPEAFQQGLKDKLNKKAQLSEQEITSILMNLDRKASEANGRERDRNVRQGEKWVAQAAKEKGAKKAKNGVVYQVIKKGVASPVTEANIVRFRFDERISSGKRISKGEIRTAQVGKMPEMIRQGMLLLGNGGKVKVTIPPQLAYGELGVPGVVPPGVASEIVVEILSIEK